MEIEAVREEQHAASQKYAEELQQVVKQKVEIEKAAKEHFAKHEQEIRHCMNSRE